VRSLTGKPIRDGYIAELIPSVRTVHGANVRVSFLRLAATATQAEVPVLNFAAAIQDQGRFHTRTHLTMLKHADATDGTGSRFPCRVSYLTRRGVNGRLQVPAQEPVRVSFA